LLQLEGDAVEAVMAHAEKLAYELQPMYKELQVGHLATNSLQDGQQLDQVTTAAYFCMRHAHAFASCLQQLKAVAAPRRACYCLSASFG
jgi:hypothetical protein